MELDVGSDNTERWEESTGGTENMPVIRVSKIGKCIQKLREERGWRKHEKNWHGTYLLSPEGKIHGEKWYKRTRQDDQITDGYILNVHADSLLMVEIHCQIVPDRINGAYERKRP